MNKMSKNYKISYPFDSKLILRKKNSIRRELLLNDNLVEKKIFIANGSTTKEIVNILEIFLLSSGIKPIFFEGEYCRYYEELTFKNNDLEKFKPDIIYIHTSRQNLLNLPTFDDSSEEVSAKIDAEFLRLKKIWDNAKENYKCTIIQNNFDLPVNRALGNLDCYAFTGITHYITTINLKIAEYAREKSDFLINDINYLSSWIGLENWYSSKDWYSSKYSIAIENIPYLSHNICSIINASLGKSKKALVLDLDNTLWGGVIGDDGVDKIKLGKESAISEAYSSLQTYIKELFSRGIILSVASKNELSNALEGINHPDSILKEGNFASIKANWRNKHENISEIAKELNIFEDSMVFVDDNPAERLIVEKYLPDVFVPELNDDITEYINIIDKSGLFEPVSISGDDMLRNENYQANKTRAELTNNYSDYQEYLLDLDLKAEISCFKDIYLDRIVQLINKTNQFNLTSYRYSLSDIIKMLENDNTIALYGRLEDRFGDNGLVSVIIARKEGDEMSILLWVMSCRVFKRDMEYAMFDELIKHVKNKGCTNLIGRYIPTKKNSIVSPLFNTLGFNLIDKDQDGMSSWAYNIEDHTRKNQVIKVANE
jgi:FkbH-like protein